jgi:hypothetical protein
MIRKKKKMFSLPEKVDNMIKELKEDLSWLPSAIFLAVVILISIISVIVYAYNRGFVWGWWDMR